MVNYRFVEFMYTHNFISIFIRLRILTVSDKCIYYTFDAYQCSDLTCIVRFNVSSMDGKHVKVRM
jgi:hypothetical protein